ncbi:MAG: hypothetical protein ACKPKO_21345, partial [Candidatus Fonsibacter sp.]
EAMEEIERKALEEIGLRGITCCNIETHVVSALWEENSGFRAICQAADPEWSGASGSIATIWAGRYFFFAGFCWQNRIEGH